MAFTLLKKRDPLTSSIKSTFLVYTIPSVLSMLCFTSAMVIDAIFVGQYVGSLGIAAMAFVEPVYGFMFGIIFMLVIGSSVLVGNLIGAKRYDIASVVFTKSLFLALSVSILFAILGVKYIDSVINLLGVNEETFSYVKQYLFLILCFIPANACSYFFSTYLRLEGFVLTALFGSAAASIVNIILDYLFLAKYNMGMQGAALATGIATLTSAILVLVLLFMRAKDLKLSWKVGYWAEIFRGLYNGASECINQFSAAFIAYLFNITLISRLGTTGVAAFGVINYFFFTATSIYYSIGDSVTPLISQNNGAKQMDRVFHFFRVTIKSGLIVASSFILFLLFFPDFAISLFVSASDVEVHALTKTYLFYFWPAFLFTPFCLLTSSFFTATLHAKESMLIAVMNTFLFPLFFIYFLPSYLGDVGIFLVTPISQFLTTLIAFFLFASLKKKIFPKMKEY